VESADTGNAPTPRRKAAEDRGELQLSVQQIRLCLLDYRGNLPVRVGLPQPCDIKSAHSDPAVTERFLQWIAISLLQSAYLRDDSKFGENRQIRSKQLLGAPLPKRVNQIEDPHRDSCDWILRAQPGSRDIAVLGEGRSGRHRGRVGRPPEGVKGRYITDFALTLSGSFAR
jgi:hypothetical protein